MEIPPPGPNRILYPEHIFEMSMQQMRELRDFMGEDSEDIQQIQFAPLRDMTFDEYIGQAGHVGRIKAAINTATRTGKTMPHVAFISEAGMGKTSMAACCAAELGRTALGTVGSALTTMKHVEALVEQADGGIVFVDESHDLAKAGLPIVSGLLPLLEDFMLHTDTGSREVKPFTMIMATTSFGMLDKAIRSRMGIPYSFDTYTVKDMAQIVLLHAEKRDISLSTIAADEIALRSRGNPRYCLALLQECYNMAGQSWVKIGACFKAFETLRIDEYGLRQDDRRLLELLSSGPCSLTRCATYVGLDKTTFQETIELFLFREGYITTNSRGRMLTDKGKEML